MLNFLILKIIKVSFCITLSRGVYMKISKSFVKIAVLLSLAALSSQAIADEAYDIVKKSVSIPAPDSSMTKLVATNIEKSGIKSEVTINQFGRKENELIDTVFDIKGPATFKGTRLLQQDRGKKEDDRWIYDNKLKQVRRIQMNDRTKSFVGTEFTYNDIALRNVDADKHELISSNEQVVIPNGKTYKSCWKIKSTPLKKSEVEYSYRIQYIDKETYLPAKIEYFDKKDKSKIMKVYTTEEWVYLTSKTGKQYIMRMRAKIFNNITGRQTILEIKEPVMDASVSGLYFTQQYLQTGRAK